MNYAAITGLIRVVVPSALAYAIGKGWVTQDMATQVMSFLGTIAVAGGWSAVANTNLSLAKSVAAVPGLSVHVDAAAPPELREAANDRSVPDIVPATLAPRRT